MSDIVFCERENAANLVVLLLLVFILLSIISRLKKVKNVIMKVWKLGLKINCLLTRVR